MAKVLEAKRIRRQVDERRAELLTLGLDLFSNRTYASLSIDEIAEAAGISKGLLYHYFPSKRAYYVAALRYAADQLLSETVVARDAAETLQEKLRAGLGAYLRYVEGQALHFLFILHGGVGGDDEVQDLIEKMRAEFHDRFAEVIGPGAETPSMRIILRGVVGFIEAASVEWLEAKRVPREELVESLARVVEAAFLVSVAAAPPLKPVR